MTRMRLTAFAGGILAATALVFVSVGAAAPTKAAAAPSTCLVTDIGGLNDRGFNHLAYVGLLRGQGEAARERRAVLQSRRAATTTSRTSRPASRSTRRTSSSASGS